MDWLQAPYAILLIASAGLSIGTAIYIWRERQALPGTTWVTGWVLLLAAAVWTLGYALELSSTERGTMLFWDQVQMLGAAMAPTAFLAFALQYSGQVKHFDRRTWFVLGIGPVLVVLIAFTNEWHNLLWESVSVKEVGSLVVLDQTYGPALFAHMAYSYGLLLVATFILVYAFIRSGRLYRLQGTLLLLGLLLTWLMSILELVEKNPFAPFQLTPLAFSLFGMVVAWNLVRLRRQDIMPVAWGTVIERMSDSVFVLDAQGCVLDINSAALRLLGSNEPQVVGRPLMELWPDQTALVEFLGDSSLIGGDITLSDNGKLRTYDVNRSLLKDWRGQIVSQVVVLREMTERKETEESLLRQTWSLARSNAFITALSRVTLHIGAISDPEQVMETVGTELEGLGMGCVIGTLERLPHDIEQQSERYAGFSLVVRYTSMSSSILAAIKKLIGFDLIGYRIPEHLLPIHVFEQGEALFASDPVAVTASLFPRLNPSLIREAIDLLGTRQDSGVAYLPLLAEEQVVGAMAVWGGDLREEDGLALTVFSSQVATALTKARLHAAERQRAEELARANAFIAALNEVIARIGRTPHLDQVLDTLGRELRPLGITCLVTLMEGDSSVLVIHHTSLDSAMLQLGEKMLGIKMRGFRIVPDRFAIWDKLVEEKKPVYVQDALVLAAASLPKHLLPVMRKLFQLGGWEAGSRTIWLPLVVGRHVQGAMALWGPALREEDIPTLSVFAGQVAIMLEMARLYTVERERAEELQLNADLLEASLSEKEVLLREIHHRVKNNLQVISSLLSLQSEQIQDGRTLEMFMDSRARIRSMALVHEKLHQSTELARVNFGEYVRGLVAYLLRSFGDKADAVTISVDIAGITLDIDMAITCGLITNELVSNALKHAFPVGQGGDQVRIALSQGQGQLVLTVEDNGIGFPKVIDFRNTESLGLQLVITLVEQLEGWIELDGTTGTTFRIGFAESENVERGS